MTKKNKQTKNYNVILLAIESSWVRISWWGFEIKCNSLFSKRSLLFLVFGTCPDFIWTIPACVAFCSSISFWRKTHNVGWEHWNIQLILRWYASAELFVLINDWLVRWNMFQKSIVNNAFLRVWLARKRPIKITLKNALIKNITTYQRRFLQNNQE